MSSDQKQNDIVESDDQTAAPLSHRPNPRNGGYKKAQDSGPTSVAFELQAPLGANDPMSRKQGLSRPQPKSRSHPQSAPTSQRGTLEFSASTYRKEASLPNMEKMEVKELKNPFKGYSTIMLEMKEKELTSAEKTKQVKAAVAQIYNELNTLSPQLTFKPHDKELKCKGSYTLNYDTCNFELQAWKGKEDKQYFIEFYRKSIGGRETFNHLISHVAGVLKDANMATKYGNDFQIYSAVDYAPPAPVEDDPLAMPGFGAPKCSLQVKEKDQIDNWVDILKIRHYPIFGDTFRLMAKCMCEDEDNLKMLADRDEIVRAICKELREAQDPATVHNALLMAEKVVPYLFENNRDHLKILVEEKLLQAVSHCLAVHCGYKRVSTNSKKSKAWRSTAIEKIALNVLYMLVNKMNGEFKSDAKATQQARDDLNTVGKKSAGKDTQLNKAVTALIRKTE